KIEQNISMIIFLVEKVSVNCNTYKNGWIYLLVIITIICYLNFAEPSELSSSKSDKSPLKLKDLVFVNSRSGKSVVNP
ncbi:MAG: hypothetical protein WBQ25_25600, partial [Nitrososphaeraceae archaeon]